MSKHTIVHIKKDCISCGACAAIAPEYWEMDPEGLAHLKKSRPAGDNWELDIDTEEARAANQEAADVCPVNIIHVKKKE
ncbi:MAG TPA: ferredoxin [Candidatus Nanoarchaeia archaeon]|nr:ferredoxin [Candidatus Nanoarchaeia archaeon]